MRFAKLAGVGAIALGAGLVSGCEVTPLRRGVRRPFDGVSCEPDHPVDEDGAEVTTIPIVAPEG